MDATPLDHVLNDALNFALVKFKALDGLTGRFCPPTPAFTAAVGFTADIDPTVVNITVADRPDGLLHNQCAKPPSRTAFGPLPSET
jgi:hypothetical protein